MQKLPKYKAAHTFMLSIHMNLKIFGASASPFRFTFSQQLSFKLDPHWERNLTYFLRWVRQLKFAVK